MLITSSQRVRAITIINIFIGEKGVIFSAFDYIGLVGKYNWQVYLHFNLVYLLSVVLMYY